MPHLASIVEVGSGRCVQCRQHACTVPTLLASHPAATGARCAPFPVDPAGQRGTCNLGVLLYLSLYQSVGETGCRPDSGMPLITKAARTRSQPRLREARQAHGRPRRRLGTHSLAQMLGGREARAKRSQLQLTAQRRVCPRPVLGTAVKLTTRPSQSQSRRRRASAMALPHRLESRHQKRGDGL